MYRSIILLLLHGNIISDYYYAYGYELDTSSYYQWIRNNGYDNDEMTTTTNMMNGMILFYQPWDSHCISMKSDYDQLIQTFRTSTSLDHMRDSINNNDSNYNFDSNKIKNTYSGVVIARVNCEIYRNICDENGIHKFPTIHVYYNNNGTFSSSRCVSSSNSITAATINYNDRIVDHKVEEKGTRTVEEYRGGRSYDALYDYVDQYLVQRCTIHIDYKSTAKIDNDSAMILVVSSAENIVQYYCNSIHCNDKSRNFITKWIPSKKNKAKSIIHNVRNEMKRLHTILTNDTPIHLRSWIRERIHILCQLETILHTIVKKHDEVESISLLFDDNESFHIINQSNEEIMALSSTSEL